MQAEYLLIVQEEDLPLVQEEELSYEVWTKFGCSLDEVWTKFGCSLDAVWTKLRRSYDDVSTKIGSFLRSSYEDWGPSYEVSTKIGVPKGQIRLPVDAI